VSDDQSTRWILWSRESAAPPAPAEPARPAGRPSPPAPPAGSAQRPTPPVPAPSDVPADELRSHAASAYRPGSRSLSAADHQLIQQIVQRREVTAEFQPVYDVRRDQVVGYEALSRGPQGPLRSPDKLFAAATATGLAGQLDWVCRATAFRAMLERDLPPSISLFVNVEPDSLIEPCPDDLLETIWQATARLRVFIDITGRALSRYPAEVLETVRRARAAGWGVAVADVEFSASGLALLPTLEPDVLKMNHSALTMGAGNASAAVSAVLSEAEHTRAAMLLERIEDEAASQVGRSLGAAYQIGRFLGPPGPLPPGLSVPLAPVPLREANRSTSETPWDVLAGHDAHIAVGVLREDVAYVLRAFATEAANAALPPVIASILPDGMSMQPQDALLYRMLLQRCPLILIAGRDVRSLNDWHARAADLPPRHPLLEQFCFAALSPTLSMVLVTRRDPRRQNTVDLAVSHQPATCRQVVRNIIDVMDTLEGGVRHATES
jgi:EAL domain-containing protein (putative c-di-GMP-specific phosphodiesterase class I)